MAQVCVNGTGIYEYGLPLLRFDSPFVVLNIAWPVNCGIRQATGERLSVALLIGDR